MTFTSALHNPADVTLTSTVNDGGATGGGALTDDATTTIVLADVRVGTPGNDLILASDKDSNIQGLGGNDEIYAAGGNDTVNGGLGDDLLDGGPGNDALTGGGGLDTAAYGSATTGVSVSLAISGPQDTVGAGTDTLVGISNLIGSAHNDILTGDANRNQLEGGNGDDTLIGGGGEDSANYVKAGAGVTVSLAIVGPQDTLGAGTDTLSGIENLHGSIYNDVLTGNAGNNALNGDAGNDIMDGGLGDDVFKGGAGKDAVSYMGAASGVTVNLTIAGAQNTIGAGIDTLQTIENLHGSLFADFLTGDANNNVLNGDAGADIMDGGLGDDTFKGGGGIDAASYLSATSGVTVDLRITIAQDTVGGGTDLLSSIENLHGSIYGDTLIGDAGANTINGDAGDDVLIGNGGADVFKGVGGADTFVFLALSDSLVANPDLVKDFTVGDKIDLSAIDADSTTIGTQQFHLNGTPGTAGDINVVYDGPYSIIDLYVDNDATVDARIYLAGDHHTITTADFIL